jgi:hypothetical protein
MAKGKANNVAAACYNGQGNRAQRRQHLRDKIKPAGHKDRAKYKTGDKKGDTCVHINLTDKCPVHPSSTHTWGDCFQNVLNKDKKLPAKGSNKGKTSTHLAHEANLMELD